MLMGLVLWMEWFVVGSEARIQYSHIPHYLFGPSPSTNALVTEIASDMWVVLVF